MVTSVVMTTIVDGDDECVEDDDNEDPLIELPDPVEEMTFPPDLSQYPAKVGALQQLTDNIRSQQQLKRGISVGSHIRYGSYVQQSRTLV